MQLFQQAQLIFSITVSDVRDVHNHVHSWCMKPDHPTQNHVRVFASALPRWRFSSWSEMHQACVGELLGLFFARLQTPSHLLLSGECSAHTPWTYMYQSFDVFAIFNAGPLLEIVMMMSHRPSKSIWLFILGYASCLLFMFWVCLCLFICQTGFFLAVTCSAGLTSSALVRSILKVWQQSELHLSGNANPSSF